MIISANVDIGLAMQIYTVHIGWIYVLQEKKKKIPQALN